jgi:hypothetical protein
MVMTIMAMLIIALVTVVVAPFITAFISATCWAIRLGNPGGVCTMV